MNIDRIETADLVLDLEGAALPYADNSVESVYSAHCLEHIRNVLPLMREVLRVTRVGAVVELRLPHWLHPMAMMPGHVHVISDRQIRCWATEPHLYGLGGLPKRLAVVGIHYQPDETFHEIQPLLPQFSAEQLARLMPGCCHEIHCHLTVESMK